jgi:hypothetical protein
MDMKCGSLVLHITSVQVTVVESGKKEKSGHPKRDRTMARDSIQLTKAHA